MGNVEIVFIALGKSYLKLNMSLPSSRHCMYCNKLTSCNLLARHSCKLPPAAEQNLVVCLCKAGRLPSILGECPTQHQGPMPSHYDRLVLIGLCWLYGRSEFPPPPPPHKRIVTDAKRTEYLARLLHLRVGILASIISVISQVHTNHFEADEEILLHNCNQSDLIKVAYRKKELLKWVLPYV